MRSLAAVVPHVHQLKHTSTHTFSIGWGTLKYGQILDAATVIDQRELNLSGHFWEGRTGLWLWKCFKCNAIFEFTEAISGHPFSMEITLTHTLRMLMAALQKHKLRGHKPNNCSNNCSPVEGPLCSVTTLSLWKLNCNCELDFPR